MKKLLLISTALTAVSSGAFAFETNIGDISPYVSGRIGLQILTADGADQSATGSVKAGAIGARWKGEELNLRGEFEFSNGTYVNYGEDADIVNGSNVVIGHVSFPEEYKMNTYMLNAYADFFTNYKIKPYVGAGIGAASTDVKLWVEERIGSLDMVKIPVAEFSKNSFIYGIYGGIGFDVITGLAVDLGVRYNAFTIEKVDLSMVSVNAGARLTF
ncbi:MAG: outer membrane beta-barrel protein [Rickettsiales bacterium]|jgi:opacity protein-like surface antigen|nr:outer membrane beta-barrel protein [Rickettsiales bacterium]